jgi:hypothetical protein
MIWTLYVLVLCLGLVHFRKKLTSILISGCPVCHPHPGRAAREHPPAYFL